MTKAALLVGAFIFTGIASLAVIPLPAMLVLKVAVLAGAIASASLGVYWLTRIIHNTYFAHGTSRLWRGTPETSPDSPRPLGGVNASPIIQETTTTGERLDRTARIILERHFLDGLGVTRDDCEQAGIANQAEWNLVNQVFKDTGIKGARSFQAQSYAEALDIWRNQVHIEPDAILIRKEANSWKRIQLNIYR